MDIKKFNAYTDCPTQIVWRKEKVGFEPPQLQWMQDKRMREKIMDSRRIAG